MNLTVGDITGNVALMRESIEWAHGQDVEVLLFSEMAVSGYPPEDLVLREGFVEDNWEAVRSLATMTTNMVVVVGFVDYADDQDEVPDDSVPRTVANAAAVLHQGEVVGVYHKVLLPNYGVFDEARYFARGGDPARLWNLLGTQMGVSVCEDIWISDGPPAQQAASGAEVLLNINASPFNYGKARSREDLLRAQARAAGVPVVYVNQIGGQDELVFDGCSMVFASDGTLLHRSPQFASDHFVVDLPLDGSSGVEHLVPLLSSEEEVYRALVTGLRDYVTKNGFKEVLIGLSGGIDSALTAAICVDALGADAVHGITMPSRYSSDGSVSDSEDLAKRTGLRFDEIAIEPIFVSFLHTLEPLFAGAEPNVAEENLQARIRGALLMAVSNKFGGMVVATGNKSEMAVGYATLYGDMAGGYAVLKDVFKTLVYDLARWRNGPGMDAFGGDYPPIPTGTITKPPSAELAPGQVDSDSLPEYGVLDAILERYIEEDRSMSSILEEGFDAEVVTRVLRLVDRNEYKRRQAAPGVKITAKSFGKDRRLPITNRYTNG